MTRAVLVTGGAGYIGSHTAKALAAAGYLPVTFDNLRHGHRAVVKWGPLEQGDILDTQRLKEAMQKWRPEAVLHFAGLISVGESVQDPELYYHNNVLGSLSLLQAMRGCTIDRIVFSSTAAVYGEPETVPIPESAPRRPVNPYGAGKAMTETMLEDFSKAYGLRAVSLRYFNAAGADPDGETGEAHEPETHLIPLALDAVSGRRGPLAIHGNDYPTVDGTCIRDYIHVSDLAAAHVKALEYSASGDAAAHAFNLGTGTGFSIRQVLDSIARVTGRAVPAHMGPRRPGDSAALVADPGRARQLLGWSPALSDLDTIVRTARDWTQARRAA